MGARGGERGGRGGRSGLGVVSWGRHRGVGVAMVGTKTYLVSRVALPRSAVRSRAKPEWGFVAQLGERGTEAGFLPIFIIYASKRVDCPPQNRNPTPTEGEPDMPRHAPSIPASTLRTAPFPVIQRYIYTYIYYCPT